MVKLKNLLRRMRTFNLEHPTFINDPDHNPAGKPGALTMLSREKVEVHEDALQCREIAAALNPKDGSRPTLRVVS